MNDDAGGDDDDDNDDDDNDNNDSNNDECVCQSPCMFVLTEFQLSLSLDQCVHQLRFALFTTRVFIANKRTFAHIATFRLSNIYIYLIYIYVYIYMSPAFIRFLCWKRMASTIGSLTPSARRL